MNEPATFVIRRQGTTESYPCQVDWLEESHFLQVEELQAYILDTLPCKDLYFPLTPAEIRNILSGKAGQALGAFVEDQLIAFGAVYFPKDNGDNLGRDIGLPAPELRQVVHLEAFFVHPAYRGNRLQTKMGKLLLQQVLLGKEYRHLCATVMPANVPGIVDKFAQKMKIVALKQKYNNSWRYIFYRDLWTEELFQAWETIPVPSLDLCRQLTLLNQGHQGTGYRKTGTGLEILYSKKSN
ncbi:MAG: GNAT family N-acetyltransferase [Firmicutes bacterium]|nr:GNAT family N-acetyltransferase [Bacillota bacterium]